MKKIKSWPLNLKTQMPKLIDAIKRTGHNSKEFFWKRVLISKKCYQAIFIALIVFTLSFSTFKTISSNNSFLVKADEKQGIKTKDIPCIFLEKVKEKNSLKNTDFQIAAFEESIDFNSDQSALIVPETPFKGSVPLTRTEIQEYVVQPGDTISGIAEKFGLKWSTVLWENHLTYWSIIKPGDTLRILPVDGLSHKVKQGETISSIAKKYKADPDKIIEFNFDSPEESSQLKVGQILVIPDGTPPPPPQPKTTTSPKFVQENYNSYNAWWRNTSCHRFIYGQCTSWAAFKWATEQHQCVPGNWGNANTWFSRAKQAGYQIGYTAQKGAIIVLTCTSWLCQRYGHVAYVESFTPTTVTISELNAIGYRKYSQRTLKRTLRWQNGWKILGYIYPR
ncbi:LysM peptidoglycan-binding domain-containing protein [bacterium]|nr:LysM peptidoglycan-binding domain-containing protein [bacterium]